jgi:hypothetical protein
LIFLSKKNQKKREKKRKRLVRQCVECKKHNIVVNNVFFALFRTKSHNWSQPTRNDKNKQEGPRKDRVHFKYRQFVFRECNVEIHGHYYIIVEEKNHTHVHDDFFN